MQIRPIRTDEDHETALREIEALWGAEDGTETGDRLDVLATLVESML
jgi:HTH-type transcriptional regulator/antitoxin HigA